MATETVPRRPIGASLDSLLIGLFTRAEASLTDAEVDSLAAGAELAENMIGHIATLCDGIGCLVAEDDGENGANVGSFQTPDDLSRLLWTIGNMADCAQGLLQVHSRAGFTREQRRRTGARHG